LQIEEPTSSQTDPLDDQDQRRPLSIGHILAYCIANLGNGMFWAFNNASMPLWLQGYTSNPTIISFLGGSHSFEGVVIQPLMGSLSDRLRTRWGKRRPIILLSIPISCLFLLLTPLAAHLPPPARLAGIIICVVLFTLCFNVANDPYQALLADSTSPSQRGRVVAFWFVMNAAGQVIVPLLHIPIVTKFGLVALIMLVTTAIACVFTTERSTVDDPVVYPRRRDQFRSALGGLKTLVQIRYYLLMGFFYGAGTDALVPNLTRFIKQITHCGDQDAQNAFTILVLSMGLTVIPCGWLADRVGAKRMLVTGVLLVGVASLWGLRVATLHEVWAVMALAGVATACQNAASYPLLTRLVPPHEVGLYTGLQTAAQSVAGPIAIYVTGTLTQRDGYRVIFVVCSVCTVIAMAFLARVNSHAAKQEIVNRDNQLAGASTGPPNPQ